MLAVQGHQAGCRQSADEGVGTLLRACSAKSGCQATTGEVAGALQRDCRAGSACQRCTGALLRSQVPTGEAAGMSQCACSVPQGPCNARSECQMPAGEVTGAAQRACSASSGCGPAQAVEPVGPGRWRAGGGGDTSSAEGGLLASLKPMILQLVKEAVQNCCHSGASQATQTSESP